MSNKGVKLTKEMIEEINKYKNKKGLSDRALSMKISTNHVLICRIKKRGTLSLKTYAKLCDLGINLELGGQK